MVWKLDRGGQRSTSKPNLRGCGPLMRYEIAHVLQPPVDESLKVRLQNGHRLLDEFVAAPADVRRDEDIRQPPQWIVRRQRHLREDVDCGAGDSAGLQMLDQSRFIDHAPA